MVPFTTVASANSIADPLQRGTKSLTGQYEEVVDAEKRNLSSLGEPRSGG
jgi:hypothetical protein